MKEKIIIINNINVIKKIIKDNEPNETKIIERMKKFEQDPEFKWKLLNNFKEMKRNLLHEYQN